MQYTLYAKIKKSSKYYYQNEMAKAKGRFPIPVRINSEHVRNGHPYILTGGPGGQYRLADVNLFVIDDEGHEVRIL